MTPDRLGLLIGAVFGLIYVVVNAGELDAPAGPLLQGLGVLAFIGVLAALRRGARETLRGSRRRQRLRARLPGRRGCRGDRHHRGDRGAQRPARPRRRRLPWVSLVVGTHFLALARIWGAPSLAWTGAGIALMEQSGSGWPPATRRRRQSRSRASARARSFSPAACGPPRADHRSARWCRSHASSTTAACAPEGSGDAAAIAS